MDNKTYDSLYLHKSLALCVLGLGMMAIAMLALSAPGSFQLLGTGSILGYWGAGRIHFYNRSGVKQKK